MYEIETALESDKTWIENLWKANANILGNHCFFYRWLLTENQREHWVVVRNYGFAHFLRRLDGVNTLYEIAVSDIMKRKGIGRALIDYIGKPIQLKTDTDSMESNSFYLSLGFDLIGCRESRNGKKLMNIYELK